MNKQKKVILGVMLVAIMLMAVAFAAVGSDTLYVKGSATASAVQDNFKVQFVGKKSVSNETNVTVGTPTTPDTEGATANTQISVDFSNLSKANDSEYAIIEIKNNSNGVDAQSVTVTAHETDLADWITIDAVMCNEDGTTEDVNTAIAVGESTYVKVTATLLQTVTGDDKTTTINISLEATPEQNA